VVRIAPASGPILVVLLLAVMSVTTARAADKPSKPALSELRDPVTSFAYVEPVRRDGSVGERPSPEQLRIEGKGLLVMLIAVLVVSGAMVRRHFVGR
jgi:hypothetical protein